MGANENIQAEKPPQNITEEINSTTEKISQNAE